MKILHSADWHFGKTIEGISRLEEQQEFAKEFIEIVKQNQVDLILLSGDIYDNPNPSSAAEKLFYDTIQQATMDKNTMVVVIPGNHDSPERLANINPLAKSHGIIIFQSQNDQFEIGNYGNNKIIKSSPGTITVEIKDEKAVICALPYLTEKRLGETFDTVSKDEDESAQNYQNKLKDLIDQMAQNYQDDAINLMMAHLFTVKGQISGDERALSLGGSYIVDSTIFPEKAQYIALGHIHKFQKVADTNKKAYYSGSPIHYNKTEAKTKEKSVILVDIKAGQEAKIQEINLKIYKKMEIWKPDTVQDAIKMAKEKSNENSWVYIEIQKPEILSPNQIKELKESKKDILDISVKNLQDQENIVKENILEKSQEEIFIEFYKSKFSQEPEQRYIKRYLSIINNEDTQKENTDEN